MAEKHIKNLLIASLIILFSFVSGLNASENDEFKLTGYYKSFFTILQLPTFDGNAGLSDQPAEGLVINTLRLEGIWNPVNWYTLELAYSLSPNIGINLDESGFSAFPAPDPFNYRAYDIRRRIYPAPADDISSFFLMNNIDRINMTFRSSFSDIIFGRQPIAFGSSKIVNPTDVLAPFTFNELDKEERTGVDALRLRFPMGRMGEVDIGYVFGDEFKFSNSALFAKVKTYKWKADISSYVIIFRNNLLLGFDLARSVGGATIWLEGAEVFASLLDNYISEQKYFRLSAGADYLLDDGLYGLIEYHYNGAGKIHPEEYAGLLEQTAYREGGVYLLGAHYICPGLSYEISPLISLTSQILLNANDPSFFLSVILQYNVAEDVYLDLGSFISAGRRGEINLTPDTELTAKSEFGLYPNTYYTTARFYF